MRRVVAHLHAILLAALALVGAWSLPAIGGWNLRSLFAVSWLLLAALAVLAQMQQARLLSRRRPAVRPAAQRIRRTSP